MKRKIPGGERAGPSQRQLRAGELVRHALVDILRQENLRDPDLQGVSVTIGEVRASPDLKHMTAFVSALGPGDPRAIAAALTRSRAFLRGRLARMIDLRFTPSCISSPMFPTRKRGTLMNCSPARRGARLKERRRMSRRKKVRMSPAGSCSISRKT